MPDYKVSILEDSGTELGVPTELPLTATNVSATTGNGLTSDNVQGQLDELAAAPGGGGVFGTEYEYSESEGTSTTTGGFTNKVNFTTASKPAGDYIIYWSCEITHDDDLTQAQLQFRANNTEYSLTRAGGADSNLRDEWFTYSAFKQLTLGAGTHTIQIRFRETGSGETSVRRGRVAIWRVS